ncbi:hypothetical protein F503_02193 [Ophiostoma piceae UAMH 11346]|uniref:Bola-like protein n=1 Tax=Ophiostoma piceae (strain UAMH 11346) TaxID=1262450 RepID=S3BW16_OPHP1|nr:hypothetical protein F503_02193 [Ophiostoma piceae UAMH 11346]
MICSACRQARLLVRRSASSSAAASALTPKTVAPARRFSQLSRPLQRSSAAPLSFLSTTAARPFSCSSLRASSIESASPAPTSSSSSTIPKPDFLDEAESHVWDLLVAEFDPKELSVRDISGGCGSMYGIEISSEKFRGANMLKQQRMVNAALGDLVKSWHGVQLKTRTP